MMSIKRSKNKVKYGAALEAVTILLYVAPDVYVEKRLVRRRTLTNETNTKKRTLRKRWQRKQRTKT